MTIDGNGDPKFNLRLTVILAIFGLILTATSAYVTIQVSIARAETAAHTEAIEATSRHAATHIAVDDFRELRNDMKAMNEKLDRITEDVAVLKYVKGTHRK